MTVKTVNFHLKEFHAFGFLKGPSKIHIALTLNHCVW